VGSWLVGAVLILTIGMEWSSAALRKLYHPKTKEHLDDALVLRFPHPKR
jgi:hypothetical protein